MESLSYAITSLLLGGLPWSELGETETSEICHWKTSLPGRKLCAGYPAVFGDFVDYCRALEFTELPNYSGWQDAFRTVAPGRLEDGLYDVTDEAPPTVGIKRGVYYVDERSAPVLPEEQPWRPILTQHDEYLPACSLEWEIARTLEAHDSLGDEEAIVGRIARLERVPVCSISDLAPSCRPEVILTNVQMFTVKPQAS